MSEIASTACCHPERNEESHESGQQYAKVFCVIDLHSG